MSRTIISTPNAPEALGTYSQAVDVNGTVYLSGQVGLDPRTMELVEGTRAQIERVFTNLRAVAEAAGGDFSHVVKLTVYLTDLSNFPLVNEVMGEHFKEPYPARAAVGIRSLPKGAEVEIEGIMVLDA
ncbi:MAG: RidA family protein [Gammaproteobacteria bacterium]|nr:RidA family protein [Gammaproteobacteria bacterium]NIP87858.1 RidA family protein [Gammaproteobacteria bacterium]NIR22412.1 RidA family protein [Gammaproteobacteria bacterium]NIS03984.1 RidA family protein [Gammaproteobacteria bacterium]NIV45926.1 RidA family protein [Gammaproteobacteria bacterium]